jgi:hypothetical protein
MISMENSVGQCPLLSGIPVRDAWKKNRNTGTEPKEWSENCRCAAQRSLRSVVLSRKPKKKTDPFVWTLFKVCDGVRTRACAGYAHDYLGTASHVYNVGITIITRGPLIRSRSRVLSLILLISRNYSVNVVISRFSGCNGNPGIILGNKQMAGMRKCLDW